MRTIKVNSQDLGNAGTIDTYGIYNGEDVDDMLVEDYNEDHGTDYGWDDFEWEYHHNDIVKDFAKLRADFLQNECDVIKECKVASSGSPRYYNFSTDYAMFEITYDEKAVDDYIAQHKEDYDEWYVHSGWYGATEWRDDDDWRKAENIEVAHLDYYLNKNIDQDDAYTALAEHEMEVYVEHTEMKLKEDIK